VEPEPRLNCLLDAWNMVPGDIKRAKTVNGFKNAYKKHERPWWRTPRMAKKRKTACGETTSGARHILRPGPLDVTTQEQERAGAEITNCCSGSSSGSFLLITYLETFYRKKIMVCEGVNC
jgi:hypothetical protein